MTQVSDRNKTSSTRKHSQNLSLREMLNPEATDLYNHVVELYSTSSKQNSKETARSADKAFRYLIRSAIENTTDFSNWDKRTVADYQIARFANDVDYRIKAYNFLMDDSKENWRNSLKRSEVFRKANWQIIRGGVAIVAGAALYTLSFF